MKLFSMGEKLSKKINNDRDRNSLRKCFVCFDTKLSGMFLILLGATRRRPFNIESIFCRLKLKLHLFFVFNIRKNFYHCGILLTERYHMMTSMTCRSTLTIA